MFRRQNTGKNTNGIITNQNFTGQVTLFSHKTARVITGREFSDNESTGQTGGIIAKH
jgi:hypothetical protein